MWGSRSVLAFAAAALLWTESPRALAKHPFLSASSDGRVLATFSGTEWSDELGPKELPLSVRVATQRIGTFAWGDAFRITFEPVAVQTSKPRVIAPLYLLVTDKEIIRISADKPEDTVAQLKDKKEPPQFAQSELYGLSQGQKTYKETALTVAKIVVKGDRCRYSWNHKSGHFLTLEWQRGVGLIEFSQGRGAKADGYRLKRGVMPVR